MRNSILLLIFALLLIGCSPATSAIAPTQPPLIAMTFMAGYKPQANLPFVGVYLAKEKGFFTQEGLDVTIEHSPGKGEHVQLLTAGKIQVTTMDAATVLQRRAEPGLPVVSIALIGQRGQQAFAALADQGMKTPKDWEGKLVGYKGTPPPDLYALLAVANADINKIHLVNVGFDPRILSEGKVDVYPLFKSNEPYLLQKWGYSLDLWDAADYGVPTLGLTYVTSQDFISQHPEVLSHFIKAALQGIQYAADHPDEAVQVVMKYAGPETDPEHMHFMLLSELMDAQNSHGIGWQSKEQWQALEDMLLQYQALPKAIPVDAAFTTKFLP